MNPIDKVIFLLIKAGKPELCLSIMRIFPTPSRRKRTSLWASGFSAWCTRALGANRLYISSSESKNTVEFYRSLGCELVSEVDWELFALEPKDIHMELDLDRLVENG